MFFGFDLKEILMFPVRNEEARRHLLVGCLVGLSAFIIPLLPHLVLYGYAARIARQVLKHETPHMVAWDDWGGLAQDGIKLFGIRIILSLPILIFAIPMVFAMIGFPIIMGTASDSQMQTILPLFMLLVFGGMCILIPLSIPLVLIIPGAEMYVVDKDDFSAGFRLREWWPIFRANMGGFLAAFGIYYLSAMAFTVAIQIIGATIILACLMFVLLPLMTVYLTLIMYVTIAQAYRDGKLKLAETQSLPQAA